MKIHMPHKRLNRSSKDKQHAIHHEKLHPFLQDHLITGGKDFDLWNLKLEGTQINITMSGSFDLATAEE